MNAQAKQNSLKLIRLIVEQGTKALRNALEDMHPPAKLQRVLAANRKSLSKLKPRLINDTQWNLLFPPSGNPPDLKSFDVTLLTVLLRNISSYLHRTAIEWDTMPPDTDRSIQANVVRIKLLKNEVYANIDSTEEDEAAFEHLWQQISQALVDLGIPQADIDIMKTCIVSFQDGIYIETLEKWFLIEEEYKDIDMPAKHSSRIAKTFKRKKKGSRSNRKTNVFFDDFVCGHLAKDVEARRLVTLKEQGLILRFNNVDIISSIYLDFKNEDSRKSKFVWKKNNKNLEDIMARFEEEGLLEKVSAGIKRDEKYLKYKVKNDKIWSSLSKKYSVQRISRASALSREHLQKPENCFKGSDSGISSKPSSDTAESPPSKSYMPRSESFDHSAEMSCSSANILARPENPSRGPYRSRNENMFIESPVRRKHSLQYRSPNEDVYHAKVGAKGLSVSCEDISHRPDLRSNPKMNVFLDDFVCDHLAKHAEAQHLVTLKEKGLILRFTNVDKINSIYWEFKKGDSRKWKLHLQIKKKCLKKIMAKFEEKGLVKNVGAGIKCDEKYLEYEVKNSTIWGSLSKKYEVKNSKIWGSLSKKYSVQRNPLAGTLPINKHLQKRESSFQGDDSGISSKRSSDTSDALNFRPPFGPYRSRNEDIGHSAEITTASSSSSANIFARQENPLCRPYRSRNEKFYHSADRITPLFSSTKSVSLEIPARRKRSLQYRLPNEDFYNPRVGAKGLSVSSEDIGHPPESSPFKAYRSRNEDFDHSAEISSSSANILAKPARRMFTERRVRRKHSLQYRSPNEGVYPAKVGAKGLSVSCGDISHRPATERGTPRYSLSSQVITMNGENVGDMHIHVLQDSSSSFKGSGSHDASQHASKISSIEEKEEEEDFGEDSTEADEDTLLEERFLDEEYCIKDEIHEKFKRFPWLHGAYGITGPNEKFPRSHFYVTVEKGKKESEILDDIKAAFDCEPSEYFELLPEPEKPVKFKFLLRPTPGGGIAVKEDGQNPLQASNNIEDEESNTCRASGTLTMFCCKNDKHYALTCFHVGVITDRQRFDQAFNQQDVLDIRKSRSIEWYKEYAKKTLTYCYREKEIGNTDENENAVNSANRSDLGTFSMGSFDEVSDIMSIEVDKDIQVHCTVAEVDSPVWARIWQELNKRVIRKRGIVPVRVQKLDYSSNLTDGYIDNINFSYNHEGELLFRDAIAVKSDSIKFLHAGDSGALICYLDSKNRKQAFAYGVCEIDTNDSDEEVVDFREENEPPSNETDKSLFICLRLNKAMRNLELSPETGCFKECGRSKKE